MGAILIIASIIKGLQLVGTLGPIAVEVANEIKNLLEGSGNFVVDIQKFQGDAEAANQATLQMIADWKTANGIVD